MNAESLSSYIIANLKDNRLDIVGIVLQGYDGASVMSGHCSGVQQRIKVVTSQAVYVHCYAHCLNLVLADATKKGSDSADFFAIIESLCLQQKPMLFIVNIRLFCILVNLHANFKVYQTLNIYLGMFLLNVGCLIN